MEPWPFASSSTRQNDPLSDHRWVLILPMATFGRVAVLPDLNSSDRRLLGFELFRELGSLFIQAGLCLLCTFYLTILQNIYINTSYATGIFSMIFGEPIRIAREKKLGALDLLHPNHFDNFSISWAQIGGIVVIFILLVLIPGILLSVAAIRGKSRMLRLATSTGGEAILGCDSTHAVEVLGQMEWWPYQYLKLNLFLALAGFLFANLFWPHLAVYLFIVALIAVLATAAKKVREHLGPPPLPPDAPAPSSAGGGTRTLALWREKLAFLEEQEAIAVDGPQKFALRKQIEEAREKVREQGE